MAAISSPALFRTRPSQFPDARRSSARRPSHEIAGTTTAIEVRSPSYQAFRILQFAFVVVPILAGLDKFFDVMTRWGGYLSAPLLRLAAHFGGERPFMQIVGVVEMCVGLLVAFKPKVFAWVLAAWLFVIVVNLLALGEAGDVALRDLGLMLGAVALARLGARFDGAIQRPRYVEREMGPDSCDLVKP